jgi:murein DD-endopeptidase MepM/ murein hydrolase activator NlpD
MANTCLSNNECNSSPGESTQMVVQITPYFPVRHFQLSPQSNGRSWLGNGSWGDYGHNRPNNRAHSGCDIYAQAGESVYAVKSGTIIAAEVQINSAGWGGASAIAIDHGDYIIRYCEIKNVSKTSGSVVQGEKIGEVSTTTFLPSQSMLHLEMYDKSATGSLTNAQSPKMVNSRPIKRRVDSINPTPYLEQWVNNIRPEE